MASSEPGAVPDGAPGSPSPSPQTPEHEPTPFERRARWLALVHGVLGGVLSLTVVDAVRDGGLGGPPWWQTLVVLAGVPSVPLFAALPIATPLVAALGAVTSFPVWTWAGGALARRIEPGHGADWSRWWARWTLLPLGGLFMAFVFVGGLTPMGS